MLTSLIGAALLAATTPVCTALPAPVTTYLADHPAFHVIDLPDLRPEDVAYWAEEAPGQCPGFVDFDADGSKRAAYGLLLIARHGSRTFQQLVILMPDADGYAEHVVHAPMDITFPDLIERAEPGAYQEFPFDSTPRIVTIPNEGVIYIHPETSSSIIYLKDGQFEELFTQD